MGSNLGRCVSLGFVRHARQIARRRWTFQSRVRRRIGRARVERGARLLIGRLVVEFEGRYLIHLPVVPFKVGRFPRVVNALRFQRMFLNECRTELRIGLPTRPLARLRIGLRRGLVFLLGRPIGLVYVMVGREAVLMDNCGHVPIRVPPITVI